MQLSHWQQCHRTDLPAEGARIISASVTLAGGGGGGRCTWLDSRVKKTNTHTKRRNCPYTGCFTVDFGD